MDRTDAAVIEAALFMSARAMGVDELARLVARPEGETRLLIGALAAEYASRASGLCVLESDEGFRLSVRDDVAASVAHLAEKADISEGELRTLAVIACYEPLLQSELVRMRGNNAYEHVAVLVEKGYVRSSPSGRTRALATTDRFRTRFAVAGGELARLALAEGEVPEGG